MADFMKALQFTLAEEGGEGDALLDHGGHTNLGITQETLDSARCLLPDLPGNVHDLTTANAAAVYHALYWKYDAVESQAIATKIFDMGANMGPGTAVRLAQHSAVHLGATAVSEDGHFGPVTLAAINACDPGLLMSQLCKEAAGRYVAIVQNDPSQHVWLHGWLNRAGKVPSE